ncbi:hypothetical protein D3C74_319440 [compost metagenome]
MAAFARERNDIGFIGARHDRLLNAAVQFIKPWHDRVNQTERGLHVRQLLQLPGERAQTVIDIRARRTIVDMTEHFNHFFLAQIMIQIAVHPFHHLRAFHPDTPPF